MVAKVLAITSLSFAQVDAIKIQNEDIIAEQLSEMDTETLAQTSADTEFIGAIIKGLIKQAAAPLLGDKIWAVGCGGKAKDGKPMACDDDPVVTYISSHKTKPTVEHKTI